MKALVKEQSGPGIALRELPDPVAGPGQVVVRVAACGISGSEIARYRWTDAYHAGRPKDMTKLLPRIMGHEFSGTIAASGTGVAGLADGMPVVVQPVIGCGACESCDLGLPNHCRRRITIGVHADGGFAEYCVVPAGNVYPVPPGIDLRRIALMQPFAIAAYALEIGGIGPATRVGVWGVGQIGLSIIQQAIMAGASVEFAVGRDRGRVAAARALGVRNALSVRDLNVAQHLHSLYGQDGLDAIFETSGHTPAVNAALALLRPRGRVVLIGNLRERFDADLLQAIMDQLSILSVRTYSLAAWRRALALIGRVEAQAEALPVTRLPLAEGVRAFEQAAAGAGSKFVLEP